MVRRSDSTRATSHLVTLIIIVVTIAALYFARVVLVPLALAILFAFLLMPIVRVLDRIHVPRVISSVGIVAITVAGLGFLTWTVAEELVDVANQLPAYRSNIRAKIAVIRGPKTQGVQKAAAALNEISKEIVTPGQPAPSPASPHGSPKETTASKPVPVQVEPPASSPFVSINTVIGPVSVFGLATVFTLFMLMCREDLRNRFIVLVGHQHINTMTQALDDAGQRVSRYLFLQLSVNVGYGLVIAFGLYFIGVPHVLLWGVVAALFRFLPYVGAWFSGLLPILLSVALFGDWSRPLMTVGLYVVAELLISNLVEPLLYGTRVGLSSLAILVAAVFWTVLWGPAGLILATPLTVCLAVIGRYVPNLGFLNIVLGDEPVLATESHFYQRLLASDQHEAKLVLEEYLKEHNLIQLYDSVVIPALALAEQDRHRNDLDEETQQFITLGIKELLEDLSDRDETGNNNEEIPTTTAVLGICSTDLSNMVVCVPARDDADEIVGLMLSQLLERSGRHSRWIPVGRPNDMIALLEGTKPDIICVSALPPLAISHARRLYWDLCKQFPDVKILIGLWGLGDNGKIANRMKMKEGDRLFGRLEEMLTEINGGPKTQEGNLPQSVDQPTPAPA